MTAAGLGFSALFFLSVSLFMYGAVAWSLRVGALGLAGWGLLASI
jgi:hypothetical protein